MTESMPAGERQFGADDVEILEESLPYRGFWTLKLLTLRHRRFAGGWSAPLRREVHCRGDAVGVLLYDPELDAIGMVEQFRAGVLGRVPSPWLLELVAGLREPGESPEEVARRETQEESGCEVAELVPIASYFSSPGGSDEYFHLYCARVSLANVTPLHGEAGEHEDIRLHVFTFAEAMRLQRAGRFDNAHSLLAMQWLAMNRDRVRAAWTC